MGKDREGNFHPVKGQPSGKGKVKGIIQPTTSQQKRKAQDRLEKKYAINPDTGNTEGTLLRHPNRNRGKDNQRKKTGRMKVVRKRNAPNEMRPVFMPDELTISKNSKELLEILASHDGICLSIYFATHKQGAEVNDKVDPTIFKTTLQQAEAELKAKTDNKLIDKILRPAYELLGNDTFWHNQPKGLAFFIGENFFKYIRLPFAPEQRTLVNSSFLVTPLVPFMLDKNKEYFYLLVVSKSQAMLYLADQISMRKVHVPGMPRGIDDVVHFEEKDDQKLFRTGSSGAGGGANYHGIGAGKPDEKENIAMYMAEVDRTLWKEVLHEEHAPLLLAAVDYLIPIFKKVTQYQHVFDEALTGSFERENEAVIHEKAMPIMQPYFAERTRQALVEFGNRSATELASSIPDDIIPAAYYARIAHLFVRTHEQLWGTFDEVNNELAIHDQWKDNDDDLMDKAVLHTLLNGGEVHLLERNRMPADSKLAAVFRY